MVLKPEPVVEAIKAAKAKAPGAPVIAMSPGGVTFRQSLAETWAKNESGLIFVCGHYEGFDERIYHWVDRKVSIGDFVLTGGELPALLIMDAVSRFVPGVLGKLASAEEDSFSSGLLEYPQYTRPVVRICCGRICCRQNRISRTRNCCRKLKKNFHRMTVPVKEADYCQIEDSFLLICKFCCKFCKKSLQHDSLCGKILHV